MKYLQRPLRFSIPNQQGSLLLPFVITLPFLLAIAASYLNLSVNSFRLARVDQTGTYAQLASDAGLDQGIQEVNQDGQWLGTGGEVTLHSQTTIRTTYQVTMTDVDNDNKTLLSIGRTYTPASSTTPSYSIRTEVKLRAITTGEYSIVSGVGGLEMRNGSRVVNGSVFVNGKLTMTNTAAIGLSILPVDVKVAHKNCPVPANATYPQLCTAGQDGQPISMGNSAHIYGNVLANNQTNGSGMTNSGLCPQTNPVCQYPVEPIPLPEYDRTAHKNAVASTISGDDADCGIIPLQTWPANLKIEGDVTLNGACIVTIEGNVWITGRLRMTNSAIIRTATGLIAAPVIMIDGAEGLNMRNATALLPNLGLVGTRIITFANSTGNPDATPTGVSLFASQSQITIDIDNTASGAQTEFYAYWTKLTAGNSGSIGAVAGQTVELRNSLAITLGTSVSGFGDKVWVIRSVKRVF